MPKHVQALAHIYQEYWEKKTDWASYESIL